MPGKKEDIFSIQIERDELHEQIGGGFPPGSICYLEGSHSGGKSVMCQRMTMGFLENGCSVTYISTELTMDEFIKQMYSLDFRISGHVLHDQLLYIPVYPLMSDMKKRDDFLKKLMRGKELFKSDIIIIDTLSALIGSSVMEKMSPQLFLQFLKKLSALGKVIILTVDPTEVNPDLSEPFKSVATSYWDMSVKTVGGSTSRIIKILRFGNAINPFEETIGFKVSPGIGIIIEITTVG